MRKSQVVDLLARRLGVRRTRLTSLVQRLAEAGMVHTSSGPPFADVSMIEAARMLLVGAVDEGLAYAPRTAVRFGGLVGPNSTTLEEAIAHALMRPEALVPARSGLELHCTDSPYAVFTTNSADGARSLVFGDLPPDENVDRLVDCRGTTLFAIASELAGVPAADVDALLRGEK